MTCTCDDDDFAGYCDVHVSCDQNCRALNDPHHPDDVAAAYEHWRRHRWLHGCSHGQ